MSAAFVGLSLSICLHGSSSQSYSSTSLRCQRALVKIDAVSPQFVLVSVAQDNATINYDNQLSQAHIRYSVTLMWGSLQNQLRNQKSQGTTD